MGLRHRASATTTDTGAGDPARLAAWDGLLGQPGPTVTIKATRAADLVRPVEVLQVA